MYVAAGSLRAVNSRSIEGGVDPEVRESLVLTIRVLFTGIG
jgi:hypothetical protein